LPGILAANQRFQVGVRLMLFQIGIVSYVQEIHVLLQGKPSMLETGAFKMLFPFEN
jgi:hypothetical protein